MTDITANLVVGMPAQLFTLASSFKANANGKIFIGVPDTDPTIPSNQIQVYVENEDGSHVPVPQPIVINSGGFPVLGGQIKKFVTTQNYSMLVKDAYGAQQFYFEDVAKYDPDQLQSRLSGSDGAKYVGYGQTTVFDSLSINVKRFGAKGDGTTIDTYAFKVAADYMNANPQASLLIPPGSYVIDDTITSKPFLIVGDGNPSLIAKNMAGKALFDMTFPSTDKSRVMGSVGVEWIADGGDIDCAILGPKDTAQYDTYFLRYIIRDNYCHGATRNLSGYSFAWTNSATRWFRVGDCVGAQISHNCIQGKFDIKTDPSVQMEECGFEFDANGAVLSARVHDNNIGPIKTGINIHNCVFMTCHDNDIIGSFDGIVWSGAQMFNEPKINDNNINAQRYGIYVDGPDSLSFHGNTIRRHRFGWKGGVENWFGMSFANVYDLKVSHNTIQPDESAGAFPGISYGYYFTGCSQSTIDGNFVGVGCDKGVSLSNCTGINLNNTITAQGASSDILFDLSNNTRITTIGQYSQVSSFSGTILSKDSTISGAITMINRDFDLQNTGNVVMELTRVNAALDNKKWRNTVGTSTLTSSIVSDSGVAANYQIITRNGASSVMTFEVRAERVRINNGPDIITGTGSPEGVVTAVKASQFLRTDSAETTSLYIKQTTTGNTGWKAL
ncbi:phage tailspike protein [Escherichia coli]|uniref:phage tailspike protein n=2 Tax=Enterobacteriaceae TaxID=543 RepID=UPI00225147A2|nr:phage tailspike protein [Escherichia coli]